MLTVTELQLENDFVAQMAFDEWENSLDEFEILEMVAQDEILKSFCPANRIESEEAIL